MELEYKRIYESMKKRRIEEAEPPTSDAPNAPEGSMSSDGYVQDVLDDPKKAAFTPTKKEKENFKGQTSEDDGHKHNFTIDADGNGETSKNHGHYHKIKNFKVQKAAGHKHLLNV